jgi:hypothetical protein
MWNSHPNERSLPDWIQTAYDVLEATINERDGGLAVEEAHAVVLEAAIDEGELTSTDAEYAIQRLLNRGYLYEVEGDLFVTEPLSEE